MRINRYISYKLVFCIVAMYLLPFFAGIYYPFILLFELLILILLFIRFYAMNHSMARKLKEKGLKDISRFTKGYFGTIIYQEDAVILFELPPKSSFIPMLKNRRLIKNISKDLAREFFKSKEALFIISRLIQMTVFIEFVSLGIYLALH